MTLATTLVMFSSPIIINTAMVKLVLYLIANTVYIFVGEKKKYGTKQALKNLLVYAIVDMWVILIVSLNLGIFWTVILLIVVPVLIALVAIQADFLSN